MGYSPRGHERVEYDLATKPPPKYKTNEHFYKAETDSQTLRTDLSLPRWMADEGGKDWEYLLEKGMATHSSILAWKIPWTEEPDGLQSTGLQSQTQLSD